MDFDLSDEQRLLADTVARLVADHYADPVRQSGGFDAARWARLAGLGLLGLTIPEAAGGSGGGAVETLIVMEAFGRGLLPDPFFASAILGSGFLTRLAHPLIPALLDGSARLALAHGERQARYARHDAAATARADGLGWVLDGDKTLVLHGDSATHLVVTARRSGARQDRAGLAAFLVPADAPGLSRRGYATQDNQRAAEVALHGVRVPADALLGDADLLDAVLDTALAALCAEMVGAMAELHRMTVEYLKQRRQFGAAIGSFQVLQHRAVDMLIAVEEARGMALYAAMMTEEPDRKARHAAMAAAKLHVNRAARLVGQEAIQLHGGIGMTMDYAAGHYFKRLTMLETLFGDSAHHLRVAADHL